MADILKLKDSDIKAIKELFTSRADRAWGEKASTLLNDEARTGDLFLNQLNMLSDILAKNGYIVKPSFKNRTVSLDLTDAQGNVIENALKFSLSDANGIRVLKGGLVKNTWMAYENSLDEKHNMVDSATMEILEMVKALSRKTKAATKAMKSQDTDRMVRLLAKEQNQATRRVSVRGRTSQQEWQKELHALSNTRSPSAIARDNRTIDFSYLIHAIAVNRIGVDGKHKYGNRMFSAYGSDIEVRQEKVDKDVKEIFKILSASPNRDQAISSLTTRYKRVYGPEGIETIINMLTPFVDVGVEVTSVSSGSYKGGRFGALSENQNGSFFATKGNVHHKQKDNYGTRSKPLLSSEKFNSMTRRNPLTTKRLYAHGDNVFNPEQALYQYIEVSQEAFEKARVDFVENTVNSAVEKQKKILEEKGLTLTDDQKKKIETEVRSRLTNIAKNLSMVGSDSYGITEDMKKTLDWYLPKNITLADDEIKRYMTHKKHKNGWVKRKKDLTETEAVRHILAHEIVDKTGDNFNRVLASIVDVVKNEEGKQTVGGINASNYTYHFNHRFLTGDKILGGQGDRATTFEIPKKFLKILAQSLGVVPTDIDQISAVTMQRDINARNFEEWFKPRMTSLAYRAHHKGLGTEFAKDFNTLLKKSLGASFYNKTFGKENYYNYDSGMFMRQDVGLSELFYDAFKGNEQERDKALAKFLVGWGKMFSNAGYGFFDPSEGGLLSRKDGGLAVNQELNKRLPLMASFNAIAKDKYGTPSAKGAVHYDQRAEFAWKREIQEAEMSSGKDFTSYRNAMARMLSTREMSKEELTRRQEEFVKNVAISLGGMATPNGAMFFDPEDWEDEEIGESDYLGGRLLGAGFRKTPLGKIWAAYQEYKKQHDGKGDGFQAIVKMPAAFSVPYKDSKGVEHIGQGQNLAIPTSMLEDMTSELGAGGIEYINGLSPYHNDFNGLLNNAYQMSIDAATGNSEVYNSAVETIFGVMFKDLYSKDGSTWRKANRALMGRSGSIDLEKSDFYSRKNLENLFGKDGADLVEKIVTTSAIVHSDAGHKLYSSLPIQQKGETDKEYELRLRKLIHLRTNDYLRIFKHASPEVRKEIFDELRSINGNTELSSTKRLEKIFKSLSSWNIKGSTVGGKYFQGLTGGIMGQFGRNPYTEGADPVFASMYFADKGLTPGHMYLAPGAEWRINADFDGDKLMAMIALNDASVMGMSHKQIDELYENQKILQDIRTRKSALGDYVLRKKTGKSSKTTVLKREDLRLLADIPGQTLGEWAAKQGFEHVGALDNIRQKIAYNLSRAMLDEMGYSGRDSTKSGRAVDALITRHVFEAMSQDAISSKKILDRYKKKKGLDAADDMGAYNFLVKDLEDMMDDIYQGKLFKNEESIPEFLNKLTDMGILDEKGFDDRVTTTLMQDIAITSNNRKYFYDKYLKGRNKGKEANADLFDITKTSDKDYYDFVASISGKDGLVSISKDIIKEVMLNENASLEQALQTIKGFYLPGKGLAIGRAAMHSDDMPGDQRDAKVKIGVGNTFGSSNADPMNKAADTLLKAAEALLQLTEGGGSGFGGGGRGSVKFTNALTAEANLEKLSELAEKEIYPISVSKIVSAVNPHGVGFDTTGLISSLLGVSDKPIAQTSNELREMISNAGTPMQGNLGGVLKIMWQYATQAGIFGSGSSGTNFKTPQQFEDLFKNIYGNKDKYQDIWDYAFKEGEELRKRAKELKIAGVEDLDLSTVAGNLALYRAIMGASGSQEISKLKGDMSRANTGMLGYSIYKTALEKGHELAPNSEDVLKILFGDDSREGRLQQQIALTERFVADKNLQYLGGERKVSSMIGNNLVHGSLDNLYFDQKDGTLYIIDDKNPNKAISAANVAQQMLYQYMAEEMRTMIQEYGGSFKEFEKSHPELSKRWGLDESMYNAFKKSNAVRALLASVNKRGDARMVSVDASKGNIGNFVSKLMEMYNTATPGSKEFQDYLLSSAHVLSDDTFADTGETLLGENGNIYGKFGEKYSKARMEFAQNLELIKNNRQKMQFTSDEESQEKLRTQIELLQKRNKELSEGFSAMKEEMLGVNGSIDAWQKYNEEINKAIQLGRVIGDIQRDAKLKKQQKIEKKEYEKLLGEYNKAVTSYESDALQQNKSTNSLEKRSLAMRMEDTENYIKDVEQSISAQREKMKSLGIDEKDIENLDAKGASRLKLMEDTMMVKNKGIGSLWDSLSTSFKNIFTRFTQMGMAYSILGKLKKAFAEVVQSATQLDKAMVNLRVVTGASYEDAKSMIHGYAKLGSELAATTLEVSTAAQEWLRQGYDVAEVNKLVESSIKLSVLGMMSASDATKSLTSAMKGFKLEAGDVSEIVDKFTSLDMKAATTAGDIATALSKFATTAQMAGVDIDQAAAMATTIMDVSQNDAGATGNALKTIFSRFGNVKAGTYQNMASGDSDDTTDKINDIERVLSTLGIQVRSSAREMRDFDDVLDDIAEKWQYLDSVSQNAIATALAGTRQRESFAVLMNNYDKYKEFIEVSKNSAGTADEKYQSYLEQFEASQKRLKAAWEDIANSSEIAGFMTKMNNFLSGVVHVLPTIIKYVTKLFVTLNSYKIPKLLNNFLGFGDKGFLEGAKEAGKKILHNLTSPGLQEKAEEYNTGESKALRDTIYDPARRVAKAFGDVAQSAKRVVEGDKEKVETTSDVIEAEDKEVTVTLSGVDATTDYISTAHTAADANLIEANYSLLAAKGDARKAEGKIPSKVQYEYVQGPEPKKHWGNNFKPSKQGAGMAAVGGLTSALMGATMGSSGNDMLFGGKQGTFEASKDANAAATINSTLSNIGYIWGPIVGMITTTLADMLNKFVIIPLIDKEANDRKARVEQANKLYDQLTGLADNVSSLRDYAKKESLTSEETSEMTDAVYQLLSEYYDTDDESRSGIEKYLLPYLQTLGIDVSSFYDVMQAYLKGDKSIKEKIARGLEYSNNRAAMQEDINKNEEKRYTNLEKIKWASAHLSENAINGPSGRGWFGPHYEQLYEVAKERGYMSEEDVWAWPWEEEKGKNFGLTTTQFIDPKFMSYDLHEYIEMIDEVIGDLVKAGNKEEIAKYEELKKQIKDVSSARLAELDAYNKQAAANALLVTQISKDSFLLDQNLDQLKYLGTDEIMRFIGKQIAENGGFSGKSIFIDNDEKNGMTDYAKEIIQQAVNDNPILAAALSGSIYSIKDLAKNNGLYDWNNRQEEYENLVASFSSALHMNQDEFIERLENGELVEKIGNMTLGDFLKTPEELRQSMEDLSSLFQSLANNAFLTAENLEKVINNYPQFIQYLGNTSNLMDAMVQGLAEYAQVYTTKIYDQLISNTDYAEGLKNKLYKSGDYNENALREVIGGATSVKEIIEELKKGPGKLTSVEYNKLVDTFTHLFDKIDVGQIFMRQIAVDTVMPYLDARLDRQLEALNKQKEALQQINKQREYENKLIEARNKLEEAGKEKTRVWREGVGWVYEANQDAIAEAQKNLQEVENERQIRELDIMIDQINAEKELIKAIQDDAKFEALEKSMTTLLGNEASETGINGLINITKKLYDGDGSIADSLGKTGETLSTLKTQLADLLGKQFDVDYRNGKYSASELQEIANNPRLSAEQRQGAREELKRRGYTGGAFNSDGSQQWIYNLPAEGKQSDIDSAIEAYDSSVNQDEIAAWLREHDYELGKDGKWRKVAQRYKIKDKDGRGITGSWVKTEDPLSFSSDYYKWIETDFKNGKAAYYKLENNEYVHQGDIIDHKSEYFDDLSRWMKAHEGYIINGRDGDPEVAIVHGGQLYGLVKAAVGSLALPGGPTLVNERGTEAIVTPYGTVTSLPTGTGVVPADVTKNLWALGEVAPAISRLLNPMIKSGDTTFGDNFNVQNMVINMNPDGSFDVDTFVNELKSVVALRKNS